VRTIPGGKKWDIKLSRFFVPVFSSLGVFRPGECALASVCPDRTRLKVIKLNCVAGIGGAILRSPGELGIFCARAHAVKAHGWLLTSAPTPLKLIVSTATRTTTPPLARSNPQGR
jgi:hypothetical protein